MLANRIPEGSGVHLRAAGGVVCGIAGTVPWEGPRRSHDALKKSGAKIPATTEAVARRRMTASTHAMGESDRRGAASPPAPVVADGGALAALRSLRARL